MNNQPQGDGAGNNVGNRGIQPEKAGNNVEHAHPDIRWLDSEIDFSGSGGADARSAAGGHGLRGNTSQVITGGCLYREVKSQGNQLAFPGLPPIVIPLVKSRPYLE